jgi:hypothetical protein
MIKKLNEEELAAHEIVIEKALENGWTKEYEGDYGREQVIKKDNKRVTISYYDGADCINYEKTAKAILEEMNS